MQHDPRCGAILCAAEEELAPFLPHLAEEQRLSRAMLTLHIGRIGGMRMVLTATGMCKVNAALAVQPVLDTVSPDFVLNAGTAGGMSPALGLFDTAVTTECAYHDVAEAILTESHPRLPSVWFASDPDLLAACITKSIFSVEPGIMAQSYEEHEQILKLIEERRYAEIEQAVREHKFKAMNSWLSAPLR